jgi:hypothetical protein
MQGVPLQPGAGADPHIHAPFSHLAMPAGSCPQHWFESLPKQFGALAMQAADPSGAAESEAESGDPLSRSKQLFPLQPGARADPHIHAPFAHVALPAGSCPQQ